MISPINDEMNLEEAERLAEQAARQIYEDGVDAGLRFALDQVTHNIKNAIKIGVQAGLSGQYDASEESIELLYCEWLRQNTNARIE